MASEFDALADELFVNKKDAPIGGIEVDPLPDSEFNELADEVFNPSRDNFKRSAFVAEKKDPDRSAEALKLSKEMNVPVDFVERNFDSIKQKKEKTNLDYDDILDRSPKLAKWMENPANATIGKDDIEPLSRVESNSRRIKPYKDEPGYLADLGRAAKTGADNLAAGSIHLAAAFGVADIDDVAETIANRNKAIKKSQESLPAYAIEFNESMKKEGGDVDKAFSRFSGSFDKLKEKRILDGLIDFGSGGVETVGQLVDQIGSAIVRPRGAIRSLTESLAFSIPALATGFAGAKGGAAIGTALAPGVGTAVGGTAGFVAGTFAGSATTEVGAWINSSLEKRGYDTSDAESIKKAYSNPKLMAEIRGEAQRKGITTASVDSLFSLFAGRFIRGAAGSGVAKKTIAATKDVGLQATGEASSEFAGQVAAQKGDLSKVSLGEAVTEGIISLGHSVGEVVIGASFRKNLSADTVTATEETINQVKAAQEAIGEIEALEQLGDIATESKAQTRSEESFAELVDNTDLGEQPQSVFFQKDKFDDFWREKGESPVEKAEELLGDGGEAYNNAQETGQPIEIPLKDYVAKLGPKEEYKELLSIVQTKPDGLTSAEAIQVLKDLPATVEELSKEAVTEQKRLDDAEVSANEVRKGIEDQLVEAGRDKIEAVPIIEFYRVMGIKENIDPAELAKQYGLKVTSIADDKVIGDKVLNQDGDEKGRIKITGNNKFNIELLKNADKSTFFHESGHYFLEVLKDMQSLEGSSKELKDDFNVILDWLGVDSAENIGNDQHEQWARGFEAYLREGKAPNSKLRKAFNTFRVWLSQVYKSILQLDVELSSDIKDVMDRMFATQVEIDQAREDIGDVPLFTDPQAAGMTKKHADKYLEAISVAESASYEQMQKRLVKDENLKKRKEFIVAKKRIKQEVTEEVNKLPIYNTVSILEKNTLADGSKMPEGSIEIKLSRDDFTAKFPEQAKDPKFQKMFSEKDGLSVEAVADMLGYDKTQDLVDQVVSAPKKSDAIKTITDQRMEKEFPDILKDETISEEAEKMIHSDSRVKRLRLEYEFLASNNKALISDAIKRVSKRPAPQKQIKEQAIRTINNLKVSQIKPNAYRLAERRFAKEAGELLAKKDIEGAFDAKQKELLNHELYRAAVDAKSFIDKSVKDTKKFFKKDEDITKTRDVDLVSAGRAILARYGLGKTDKNPIDHIQKIKEYNPDAYETVASIITGVVENPDVYTNIPLGKFNDLMDSVNALWGLAKDAKEITVDGKKITIAKANEDLIKEMQKFKKKGAKEKYDKTATDWDKMKDQLLGVKAMVRRFEHWVDVMDLGDITGPFRTFLFKSTSDATTEFLLRNKEAKQKITELSKPIVEKLDLTKKIVSDELQFEFKNKGELLGALLHIGNQGNLKKLLVGRGWGHLDEDGNLVSKNWDTFLNRMAEEKVLTKEDYEYIQSLWDIMEGIKPGAQKAHKKVFGFFFDEVTAVPVKTPFGTFRGGYAPAAIDPTAVRSIARRQELEEFVKSHQSYTYPASDGRGFTKARAENFNKPLNLDIGLVSKHVEDVLRFSIVKPAVVDAAKVITSQEFKEAMAEIDPLVIDKMIKPSLNRADKNTLQTTDPSGSALLRSVGNMLKSTSSMQLMFANVVNVAEQFGGIGISATRISPKNLSRSMFRYMSSPKKLAETVVSKSDAMKTRSDDQIFEMNRRAQNIFKDKSDFQKVKDWAVEHTFFLQAMTQNIVDNVTWSASYDESIGKGLTDAQSIQKADADVRITQSSRRPMDVSNMETSATLGFFQMFMNFFNMMANVNTSNFTKLYFEDISMGKKFTKGMYLYATGFATVAIVSGALRKAAGGDLDEDNDNEYIDDLYDVFIGSQIDLGLAMIPVAGPAINAGLNQVNDKWFDDRVSASPAVSALTAVSGTLAKGFTGKLFDDKNIKGEVRDGLTALGIVTGLPLRTLSKPVGYLIDIDEGKARPSGPIDVVRGLVTGKPGNK